MCKRPHILLVLAGFFFLFNSCKKENRCDCLKSRGAEVTETREVGNFNKLRVLDEIDVYYTHDTTLTKPVVQVSTGKNLVKNISVKVVGSELWIENNNKCNFVRGDNNQVTVYVSAPYVKYFQQSGVGSIFGTNTVTQDSVYCDIVNSGDIHLDVKVRGVMCHTHGIGDHYLSGTTNGFYSNIVGQGFMNAEGLVTAYCFMDFNSNGRAKVNVAGWLDAVIRSTGDLYYTGNPSVVNVASFGKGSAIKY